MKKKPNAAISKPSQPGKGCIGEEVSSETSEGRAYLATVPEVNPAAVIQAFSITGKQDINALTSELHSASDAVVKGNTAHMERMLVSQAHALDAIFAALARRAALNIGEYPDAVDTYMRLALRAQSQCRATLETLATIKNPPNVAFVKQANIANGPQQVNNGEAVPISRAEEKQNRPTELLEAPHAKSEWLDTRAPGTASAGDSSLETLATINGSTNAGGQSQRQP